MPRVTRNVTKRNLNEKEREEFEAVGYTEPEIEKLGEALKASSWDFWSKVSELYLTLAVGSETVFSSGKMRSTDTVSSAKFSSNYFSTASREVARLIFLSDPYRAKRIMLVKDHVNKDAQDAYAEYKTKIFSSKENLERLRKDLAEVTA